MKKCFDLATESEAVRDEILKYKWIESEKAGYDIGMSRAAQEWISKFYNEWFSFHCAQFMKEE